MLFCASREEVGDRGQALAIVGPGVFISQGEADQRGGAVCEAGADPVDEAALGLELSQHPICELRLLQEAREPQLLPAN